MTGRFPILHITPAISCGRHPARAVIGEQLPIAATVFREGHDAIAANVVWIAPDGTRAPFTRMEPVEEQRLHALVTPDAPGCWTFFIEAWSDPYATWHHNVEVKIAAGQGAADLHNDLEEGGLLLLKAARFAPRPRRTHLELAAAALRDTTLPVPERVAPAFALADVMHEHPVRDLVCKSDRFKVWVDRPRALFGSWYEFFPRSEGSVLPDLASDAVGPPVHGTFKTAQRRLPDIAEMGFDIVYLPPIHPIGKVNRKGKNNTLVAGADDVGSTWAIGSDEGGHDAIHPALGTLEDFDDFVAHTRELGMEVALDLALQCAPDHPWVKQHPEWFTIRADGTVAYAENPPKKYQDIYPLNFDKDRKGLYQEVLRVVLHWVEHGVKVFRVDNPHTKPVAFWHWLIWKVKQTHPDVIFLSEAFTKANMMHELARVGFTQSYTYFTWKTAKWELEEYAKELVDAADYMRPNFFVNTPDILHESLQYGGPAMFKIRAVLASMLSPSWGVYSGYELFEHVAVRPGSEEYLDSEKYQLRPRDWARAEAEGRSLAPYLRQLNHLRRVNPALQRLRNLRFHHIDNDAMTCFSKRVGEPGNGENTVLVVCLLDSHNAHWGNTSLDMPALGFEWHERFLVTDQLTGATYDWGQHNAVRLDPYSEPAHIFTVHRYGA
jgi:starch synthase (maltosyl-transferring)